MSEYTKGPWVIRQDDESNPYSALSVYGNEPAGFVCQTSGNCGPNARLIAAAPELLEALKELVEAYHRADAPLTREELAKDRKRFFAAIAAIDKATKGPYVTDERTRTRHSWS